MILNVSGRTDIVAFYTDWFINRYNEGFVDVRNPFYKDQISRIYFKDVDLIVFCTKNPLPIVDKLKLIDKKILFHVTITPYKKDIEPNVPSKSKIIETVKKISQIVGIDNVYIRYDPIFLSDKYNISYHVKAFEKLCSLLNGYTKHIIISFIDNYKNVRRNMSTLKIKQFTEDDYKSIGISFSAIAKKYRMTVQTCCEEKNLVEYGFVKGDCIEPGTVFKLTGKTDFKKWKARNSKNCNCVEMVDIGEYNTCKHLCKYCYANFDEKKVNNNCKLHDANSSLLIGHITDSDIIKVRKR